MSKNENYEMQIQKKHLDFFLIKRRILLPILLLGMLILLLGMDFVFFFNVMQAQDMSEQDFDNKRKQIERERMIKQYFMEGVKYYIQRDFKNAANLWQKVLDLDPDHKKAKEYFEKAAKLYTDMEGSFYKGIDSFNKEKWKRAISSFERTLFINPRHEKAIYYLEMCYKKKLQVTIKIVDKSSKKGKIIGDRILSTDDKLVLYAIGYDGLNEYVGPVAVIWSTTGTLDRIKIKQKKKGIKFSPKTFGAEGTIRAFLNEGSQAETGKITVKKGRFDHIKIMDAPTVEGIAVKKITLTVSNEKELYAVGFDKNNAYISEVKVNWRTYGRIDRLSENNSSVFSFKSKKAGRGKIKATAPGGYSAIVKNVIVRPGRLDFIRIENRPAGRGRKVYSLSIPAEVSKAFYAVGYDEYGNLIGNVKANWSTTGKLEKKRSFNKARFVYFTKISNVKGTIKAKKSNVRGDETGVIKIRCRKPVPVIIVDDQEDQNRYLYYIMIGFLIIVILLFIVIIVLFITEKIYERKYGYAAGMDMTDTVDISAHIEKKEREEFEAKKKEFIEEGEVRREEKGKDQAEIEGLSEITEEEPEVLAAEKAVEDKDEYGYRKRKIRLHNNQGVIYAKSGNYHEAAKEFKKALEIDKNNEEALFNLNKANKLLKKIPLVLFLFLCLILLSGTKKKPLPVIRSIKAETRPYSWSRKTRGFYEIKNSQLTTQVFDKKGNIIRITVHTKGNKLYEKTRFFYRDGKLREIRIYDAGNKLLTLSRFKKEKNGLYERVYNKKDEIIWRYLYLYDSYGRLKEKRKYDKSRKIKQKYRYYYNESGLLYARILYTSDGTALHMSEYEYKTFDKHGNWTLRKEYQSYADIYSIPKEAVKRNINYAQNQARNTDKSKQDEKDNSTYFKRPSFSFKSFLAMTEKRAKENTPGGRVLANALQKIKAKTIIKGSCYDWINLVYKECGYKGKKRKRIFWGKEAGPYANPLLLQPGDWIMFKNLTYGEIGHSGIFLGWLDFEKRSAIVIGYAGQKRTMPGRFREYDITRLFNITRGKN